MIEIIGITTTGTYPSWTDYCVASMYNLVDKIVVVNAGYDINNPETGAIHRLERDHNLLSKIDINDKILEFTPTMENIETIFKTTCKKGQDEFGKSTSMTLATQIAHKLFETTLPHFILKLDSDQILYGLTRQKLLDETINKYPTKTGFRFSQYADYLHDFKHIDYIPDEFTNDGALFYKSIPNQGYRGQGSPGYINVDQQQIYTVRTAHMRRIPPPGIMSVEYHFKRSWYYTYAQNSIMEHKYNVSTGKKMTDEQVMEFAHKETVRLLEHKGSLIPTGKQNCNIPIPYEMPLVCKMTLLEYIKKGY